MYWSFSIFKSVNSYIVTIRKYKALELMWLNLQSIGTNVFTYKKWTNKHDTYESWNAIALWRTLPFPSFFCLQTLYCQSVPMDSPRIPVSIAPRDPQVYVYLRRVEYMEALSLVGWPDVFHWLDWKPQLLVMIKSLFICPP